jgi:hypothetical protein
MPAAPAPAKSSGKFWAGIVTVFAIAVLVSVLVLLPDVLDHSASQRERRWFGHLASLETIILVSILIGIIHSIAVRDAQKANAETPNVPGILIGADNRLSTSKLSALAWTWVLAWAMLSLAFAKWIGASKGWNAFVKEGLRDEYLVLLSGPFVALVGAKALVGSAVSKGALIKPTAPANQTTPKARVAQAFSDDTGQTDLVDTQYLLFGSIALLAFIVLFIQASYKGVPRLPELLIGLSSVGATAYIANKWTAEDAPPHIDRIIPNSGKRDQQITIYGTHLLSVSQGGKRIPATEEIEIMYGGLAHQEVSPTGEGAQTSPTGSDYVRIKLEPDPAVAPPAGAGAKVDVSLRNALGVMSDNTAEFTILP